MSSTKSTPFRPKVVFVDQLTFLALIRLMRLARFAEVIWYFDATGALVGDILRFLRWARLVRGEIRKVEYNIGQLLNEAGDSELFRIRDAATSISRKIKDEQLVSNPLINAMEPEWSAGKVLLHFDKLIEPEAVLECRRIGLVDWMLRTKLNVPANQCALIVGRKQWFSYLEEFARVHDIRLIGYWRPRNLMTMPRLAVRVLLAFRTTLPGLSSAIYRRFRRLAIPIRRSEISDAPSQEQRPKASKIAIRYWYRKLGFDPTERTEFFWLDGSDIPTSEILLYGYESQTPLDEDTDAALKARGIKILGRGPGITRWFPTWRMPLLFARSMVKLTIGVVVCFAHRKRVSIRHIVAMSELAWDCAFWQDFYSANLVRLDVGSLFTKVGQVLALDALNGVSVSYQHSINNILHPTAELNAGEDVHFIYSAGFEQMWSSIDSPTGTFVHTGLVYNQRLQDGRSIERVAAVRQGLKSNGAQYVVCFFDENSEEGWERIISNQQATDDYEYLLNWLLADPTLGLVFKPKNSLTLFRRISQVTGLIDQANRTGRCKFLTSEYLNGDIFPAEAATAADVCIGALGGSAPLEARLAGIRTVLLDTYGFVSHPFFTWSRNRTAYSDWASIRNAVECFRMAPEDNDDFGEWSTQLSEFDSFKDGNGSARMGSYIGWLHAELGRGESKQAALDVATQKYTERWGSEHVTHGALSHLVTNAK